MSLMIIFTKATTVRNEYGKNITYKCPENAVIPVVGSSLETLLSR
jgi:hypothetical protein